MAERSRCSPPTWSSLLIWSEISKWSSQLLMLVMKIRRGHVHIAVSFVQDETFCRARGTVASGVYDPSHISIRCILYHCWIPNSAASLSETSPIIPSISLLTELRKSRGMLPRIDPREGVEPELEDVVEMRL